jgi:hypothetical protein
MKKLSTIVLSLCLTCLHVMAQTPTTPTPVALPAFFSVYGSYNQLGTPAFALTLDGIYTTNAQNGIGMVNDTTVDLTPTSVVDTATKKTFVTLSAQLNQCLMEKIVATGKFRLYGGACGGPNFASTTSGIGLSMSGSFKGVAQYRLNTWLSFVAAVRANYISGEGWNPIMQAGLSFDLKKLPAAK